MLLKCGPTRRAYPSCLWFLHPLCPSLCSASRLGGRCPAAHVGRRIHNDDVSNCRLVPFACVFLHLLFFRHQPQERRCTSTPPPPKRTYLKKLKRFPQLCGDEFQTYYVIGRSKYRTRGAEFPPLHFFNFSLLSANFGTVGILAVAPFAIEISAVFYSSKR